MDLLSWLGLRPAVRPVTPVAPLRLRSDAVDAALFDRALVHVLAMEGGYSEDPYDPGGPTNLGITLAEFARRLGLALTSDTVASVKARLRAMTRAEAAAIYRADYWEAACCPALPAPLAVFHFDAAVNQGVVGAARLLQRALGVDVDGEIGPVTRAAAQAGGVSDTLAAYAEARRAHYRSLSTFWRFGRGWLSRVDTTLAVARAVAVDPAFTASVPPATPKEPAMTESTTVPTDASTPSPKWWGQSMTIWGTLLTAVSTVLPVVAPLLGFNITAEVVQQVGESVVQFGQAAGGLVGTALAVWGRIRAATPIERRQFTVTL